MALKFGKFRRTNTGPLWSMSYANVFLTIAIILVYIYSGNTIHLISWGLISLFFIGLLRIFSWKLIQDKRILTVMKFSYLMLSLVGIISVLFYTLAYGEPFAPFSDDSYYFSNISSLAIGELPDSFTLYEVCLVPAYWLSMLVSSTKVSVQDLLPVNWALAAVTVGLATLLANRISKRFSLIASAALLINFNFVDATVHLYRDGFALVLTLSCVLCAMRKRFLAAMVFAILVGFTRGGNGILCLGYIFFFYLSAIGWMKKLDGKIVVVGVAMMIALFATDYMFHLGGKVRSFSQTTEDEGYTTLLETAITRQSTIVKEETGSTVAPLMSWGPLGLVAIPVASVFNPIRLANISYPTEVSVEGKVIDFVDVMRPSIVFSWITVISWIIIGPLFVMGLYRSIKSNDLSFIMSILFFITVIAISLISLQSRHRTAFIIFYPCIVSMAACQARIDYSRRWMLTLFFIGVFVVANILPYFL